MEQNIIMIDQLAPIELRIGRIDSVEEIAGADKLYVLNVNFGEFGKRTICAGIKQFFTPDQLLGQQALFVYNLAPRTLRGIESQGMILVAKDAEGKPVLMQPAQSVPVGTQLS